MLEGILYGALRVSCHSFYLHATKDTDPYVRKTAAVCVAKLYDISPGESCETHLFIGNCSKWCVLLLDLVEARGFLDTLVDLLSDSNPMVVSNSVAALTGSWGVFFRVRD